MPGYLCMDGPLAGNQLDWRDAPGAGETLTVVVVDIDDHALTEGPPEVDYRVERAADAGEPGLLRYVSRRGAWRRSGELVGSAGADAGV